MRATKNQSAVWFKRFPDINSAYFGVLFPQLSGRRYKSRIEQRDAILFNKKKFADTLPSDLQAGFESKLYYVNAAIEIKSQAVCRKCLKEFTRCCGVALKSNPIFGGDSECSICGFDGKGAMPVNIDPTVSERCDRASVLKFIDSIR